MKKCTILPIHLSQRTGTGRSFSVISTCQLKQDVSEVFPMWKKNNNNNNSICLFICIRYCGQELATSPGKLFAAHHWGDNLAIHTDHSLWSAMVRVMLSCIISTRQGSWINSLEILVLVGITPLGTHSSRFFQTKKCSKYSQSCSH